MPNVKFRASRRTLTSHAGLSIIGQCLEIAGVDSIDSRFPTTLGMRTSDVIKSYLGLLCLGMSDYNAIENFRRDKPFQQLLTLQKVPSTATLRQWLEKFAANDLQALTASWSTTLLSLVEAPITAETTHVCLDIDTFVMDNSNSKKEGVSRTYQKVDGYTPIAAYLGNEGWCLGLELRPGKRQALWTQTVSIRDDNKGEYVVKRVMRLVERTTDRDGQLLVDGPDGHDRRAESGTPSRQAAPATHSVARAGASCGPHDPQGATDHPRRRA